MNLEQERVWERHCERVERKKKQFITIAINWFFAFMFMSDVMAFLFNGCAVRFYSVCWSLRLPTYEVGILQ